MADRNFAGHKSQPQEVFEKELRLSAKAPKNRREKRYEAARLLLLSLRSPKGMHDFSQRLLNLAKHWEKKSIPTTPSLKWKGRTVRRSLCPSLPPDLHAKTRPRDAKTWRGELYRSRTFKTSDYQKQRLTFPLLILLPATEQETKSLLSRRK